MLQGLLVQVLPIIHSTSIYEERVHQSMELQRLQSWWRLLHIANLAFIKCYLCYAMCRLQVHNILWKKNIEVEQWKSKRLYTIFFHHPDHISEVKWIAFHLLLCTATYIQTYLHNSAKWVSSSRSNLTTWLYTQACGITAGPLFGQNSQKSLAKYWMKFEYNTQFFHYK